MDIIVIIIHRYIISFIYRMNTYDIYGKHIPVNIFHQKRAWN